MVLELLNEEQTAELLAQCEAKLGELYQAYAGLFPEEAAFWEKLAKDERAHANWIASLLPRVRSGTISFREDRLGSPAFILFYDYLVQRLAETRNRISLLGALVVAMDIENTLVEKSFYNVFTSADPESARILALLSRSADAHLRRVQEQWRLYQAAGVRASRPQG
ncbi:MAG: ferritin family protein [Armatimonadota bacterium]